MGEKFVSKNLADFIDSVLFVFILPVSHYLDEELERQKGYMKKMVSMEENIIHGGVRSNSWL